MYDNFYAKVFAFLTSKSLYFLVLSCIISSQALVAQTPYVYWQLENYTGTGPYSWDNGNGNYLANVSNQNIIIPATGCVGNGIQITTNEVLAARDTNMKDALTSNMAFEFLMKPNPTDGESKLLVGTQFARLLWSIDGFRVTTLFKKAQNVDEDFQVTFPFQGLGKASPDYYTDGNWHHIVVNVIVDGQGANPTLKPTLELWVDGQKMNDSLKATGTVPFLSPTSYRTAISAASYVNRDLAINFSNSVDYDGFLDEIALYNSNLSPQSILEHYTTSVKDSQHYNIAPTTPTGPLPPAYTAPTSIDIDPKEFSPTIGTATGAVSSVDTNGDPYDDAIEEFKLYPMPRFKKKANGDIPLLRNHPNYISPNVTQFYTINADTASQIVWGETGGVNPRGKYGNPRRTPIKIIRDNMNYLNTELYDKWNYNLMIDGFNTGSICDPETSKGLLLQTAMQNPSKPLTVITNMGDADGNQGISTATDFIYTPIELGASDTITNEVPEPYILSFDNGNMNCQIFNNSIGCYIRAWGYDAAQTYAIIMNGQTTPFTMDSITPLKYNDSIPALVNIKITKAASIVADFDLEGLTTFILNSVTTPCFFTRIGTVSGNNSAAFPIKSFTSYPLEVTFNYQSSTEPEFAKIITLLGPNLANATRSNHEFQFKCPTGYNAKIFTHNTTTPNAATIDYYKITTLLDSVSAGATYTTGAAIAKSYRIVLTDTSGASYTLTFNLTKTNFLCLNTREKCKIYWGGDTVSDPNKIIYLYNRSSNQLITRYTPIYYHGTWDAKITKAFLSPFATDSANLPVDFFKQWGLAYRDAVIVPFIEATGFNRRINMLAENGEVLASTTKKTDIDDWMRSPGVVKNFTQYCFNNGCTFQYPPPANSCTDSLWENYVKTELHIGLDIERYMDDTLVVSHCATYFANLPVAVDALPGGIGFNYGAFRNNDAQIKAWEQYTTEFIYKPYIDGYRAGIFTPTPLSAQDCAGDSITINYANIIDTTFTDFSIYDLRAWNYTIGREVTTKIEVPFTSPTTNNYYNTNNLYIVNLLYWNSENAAANQGLKNIREELQDAIAVGDKFSSPYVTPTSYYASNWRINFKKDIRPGQWLGMLKYTAVTGAEFFYPFYYLQGDGKKASANNHIWQLTTSAYVQAISSRYIDIFRNGSLMQGDYLIGDDKAYTFNAHNPSILIAARKLDNKYIISGNIGSLSNHTDDLDNDGYLDRFSPLSTDATIKFAGHTDFQFKVRRQGSVYYYEQNAEATNTLNTQAIFYQLDGWHEYSHPHYWSKDFVFQAELFDNTNIPNGCGIRTLVDASLNTPATNTTFDFTKFKTYLTFGQGFEPNTSKLSYNFEPRSTDNNEIFTYALTVSARKKPNTPNIGNEIIYAYLDNNPTPVCSLTVNNTNWTSYISFKVFSVVANTNHTLTLGFSNENIEIDSLKLGQDIAVCKNQYIVLADINAPMLPNGSNYTYSWTYNNDSVPIATAPTHTIPSASTSNSGLYTLTIRDGNGLIIYSHTISVVVSNLACASCPVVSDIEIEKSIFSTDSNTVTFEIVVKNHGCKAAENIWLKDTWVTGCFTYTDYQEQAGVSVYHQYEPSNPNASMDIHIASVPADDGVIKIYLTYNLNYRCQDCDNCVSFVGFDGIEIYADNNEDCVTIPSALDTNANTSYYVTSGGIQTLGGTTPISFTGSSSGGVTQYFTVVVPEYTTVKINGTVNMTYCDVVMMPGSKILIPSGKVLNLDGCRVHGCTEMWAGIEVNTGGKLDISTSQIKDAANAITLLKSGANVLIDNTDFMQNYVGIYSIPTANGTTNFVNNYLKFSGQNTFSCNSPLLPYYLGQANSIGDMAGAVPRQYAYSGIVFYNADYDFNLLPSSAKLDFKFLNNGFIAYASNIRMNGRLQFAGIRQYDPALNHHDGAAIFVHGKRTGGYLTYQGNGVTNLATIISCHYGLYAEAMQSVYWHDSRMLSVDVGTYLSANKLVKFYDSHLTCSNFGAYLNWNANTQTDIFRNKISMIGSPHSPAQFGTQKMGIASFDFDLPTQITIEHDTINMVEGQVGMYLVSAGKGFQIHNNLVNLQNATNLGGICLNATHEANVSCNEVVGDYGVAYGFAMSNDLEVACNIANETPTGFSFWGTCTNTKFRGNYMQNNPQYGLYLSPSALIGQQHNTGNIWLGSSQYARFDLPSNTPVPAASLFFLSPYSGVLLPSNIFPGGTDWFKVDSTSTQLYSCANSNSYCNGIDIGGMEFTKMDENILEENLGAPQYLDEAQREAEAYLYEKVKDNPILQQQNVDVEEFYEDKSETNIGAFSEVKDGVRNLYLSPQDSLLNLLQDSVKLLLGEIYVNDSLLATDTLNVDSVTIIATNQTLYNHISDLQAAIQTLSQTMKTERQNEVANLSSINAVITTTRQMETNERVVNNIYLQTVGKDIYTLNSTQVSSLESIIYQCPLAGGSAVFKARSLYTLHSMQLWYNDDSLCNLVNMEWRHSQTTNIDKMDKLQVYPNPTEGEITFDFELVTQQQGELLLYNLQGQEVFKYKIPTETDKFTINLSSLVTGMYMYKITGNESFTGKIIIE